MYALSLFIGLLALSVPISGLSVSATHQELINNDALLADAASSIKSFASSLGSEDFTLDAATSMEFLSDMADFVSLGSQQISALQAHPFIKANPYSQESLREVEMIFDELASDITSEYQGLVSDNVRTNEVASRLVRRAKGRNAGLKEVKASVHQAAGKLATKVREKFGITSAGVSKWAGRAALLASGTAALLPPTAVVAAPVAVAAGVAKALAERRIRKNAAAAAAHAPAAPAHAPAAGP
ncbi:hypothetical protein BC829DRAFT_421299 [Chytridium lagenaria]|nr:hypothetical protein BC829DRAFT_421299 [Chytridium lagenaria]